MSKGLIFLFVLVDLFTCTASAQQNNSYTFRHIDQSDGLLHNEVFSITQDKRGFMWIGTTNGLQRYDGFRFVNYQDKLSVWNNKSISIYDVYAGNDSSIWISSELQLGKLELFTGKFTSYDAEQMLHDTVFKYEAYSDDKNNLWLLGNFCIYKYNAASKKMELILLDKPYGNNNGYNNIVKDKAHNITWAITWNSLLFFNGNTKKVYSSNQNEALHPLLKIPVSTGFSKIIIDSHKNIWLCSFKHLLYKYDPLANKIYTYSLSDIKKLQGDKTNYTGTLLVNCLFEDSRSNLWIGTENAGLLKYNVAANSFEYITATDGDEHGLRYNYNVFSIFEDKEENIWIGTDKGINIFNPYHQNFQSIHYQKNNQPSLPKNEITDFIEVPNGDIIAGTWGGGITIFDNKLQFKKNIIIKGIAENNLVWSFLKDDAGKILIGCQHGYLHKYDPANESLTTIHPAEFERSTIRCMQKDLEGNIWFGLHNGKIAEWDKLSNRFLAFNNTQQQKEQIFSPVYNIFIDKNKNYWAATAEGLKQFDPKKRVFSKILVPGNNNHFVSSKNIQGIEQYNDSTLLIGTLHGGILSFNVKTKRFFQLQFSSSFSSSSVHAIKKDEKNNIWFTTDYGLYKINPGEKRILTYNIDAELINSSFNCTKFYQLNDGRWLTASSTDIISFHPDSLIQHGNYNTKVAISGFTVFDKPIFIDSLFAARQPVKLTYNENFITIQFAAPDFSNILQTKFYYRLSGVDKEWVNAGTKGFASYTNLDPGNYTFSVKPDEDASAKTTSFSIIISAPFWKTWWFTTLVILLIAFVIYAAIKRRIKTIKHEAALKHKIAETEMMALRAQMNPHFIFNCINAIDNLIQTNKRDKATTYLTRFAKLIRVVLDSSKNNVVPFYKDYEALNLFLQLEQFRCSNKFEYEIKADEEILNSDYKVPPLLVQPFIENAIHHGLMNKQDKNKKLSVNIGVENKKIKYSIIDNGVGRQKALQIKNLNKPEHISYGIQISKERIHLYNNNGKEKDIEIIDLYENGKAVGTRVDISIKIFN